MLANSAESTQPSSVNTKMRYTILQILFFLLLVSCKSNSLQQEEPTLVNPGTQYEYKVGLGYGFLGKAVQVKIDGVEVISIIGTNEIEQYAQLKGTKILASGLASKKEITVQVIVDGGDPYVQVLDLSTGIYLHVYQEPTGLHVYNTKFLVLE